MIRIHEERLGDALELVREALRLANPLDSKAISCLLCEPIAMLLGRQGHHERAAQVLGKRLALRDEVGRPRDWFRYRALEETERRVQKKLGDEAFLEALDVGALADARELFESALKDVESASLVAK